MERSLDLQLDFAFFNVLQDYYINNKGRIRRNYTDLTRKFLNYNDKEINLNAFLRKPQFEALEMYVFIKEFFNNMQVNSIFEDYMKKQGNFAAGSFYSHPANHSGQMTFMSMNAKQNEELFKKMKKVSEDYPNYIYALTMGLGKTILMATCIFYEFLVANKNPKDKRFCHNVLVFAPDKTVLESLREIVTFDKSLVVPPEYARVLDSNIKVHFLEDTGTTLNTLDDSDFNIIISNTQKIIVKKKHKDDSAGTRLFNMPNASQSSSPIANVLSSIYGDDDLTPDDLIFNQRFKKLCRLSQIGVFVDEAHHLFGTELEKSLHTKSDTSLRSTINLLAAELKRNGTSVVACYNYTGTPYVKNEILPEVVYSYGLRESINNRYLKEANITAYENVKSKEFLRDVITRFWSEYGNKTYEGLVPKLAIFGTQIEEVEDEIRPTVERILSELGIPLSKIIVNVGDSSITKSSDIHDFNNLDRVGASGSEKQFILLVNKGGEGWNCRSLFGVALYRSPKSKVFVLQATMRCLRQITDEQQTARIFLSKENFDILDDELSQNFQMSIEDMKQSKPSKSSTYKVRVLPPPKYINIKTLKHEYVQKSKSYSEPIDFELRDRDLSKYEVVIYEKSKLGSELTVKSKVHDDVIDGTKYSFYTLIAEISRYLNEKCVLISKIVKESIDGADVILEVVNRYNEVIYDILIPTIFKTINDIETKIVPEDKKILLLKEPENAGYYTFHANPELVVQKSDASMIQYQDRSFHADTYCFDSKPEKECFLQYITNADKVKKIYFTGMFTSNQGELAIPYCDPETNSIRNYYPDFLAEMADDTYQIIEVKGDNKIDDAVVKAKADAAKEIATESAMEYKMYAGSFIMKNNIFEYDESKIIQNQFDYSHAPDQSIELQRVAEDNANFRN